MTESKAKFNLDYTFKLALEKLLQKSYQEVCKTTGATYDNEIELYQLRYLNTTVTVSKDGEVHSNEKQLTLQEKILILHYLLGEGNIQQTEEKLISFKELPGGEIYLAPFTKRAIRPFIDIFADHHEKLAVVAEKWGGVLEKYGDKSINLTVFPYVNLIFVLWLGDEEFSANATVLFKKSIADYFTTEDVAVLVSQLIYQMPSLIN